MRHDRRLPFVIMKFAEDLELWDTFDLAIKPALKEALGLSEEDLRNIRIDEAIAYEHNPATSLPSISESILEAIRNCLFVICDTTGNRPNCYFELGYALANRKYIFAIHKRKSKPPHFDISGRPILFYSSISQLREKLRKMIDYHFGGHVQLEQDPLKDFFDRLGLPLLPLEGDAKYDYRLSTTAEIPVVIELATSSRFVPTGKWRRLFNNALKKHLEKAESDGDVLFNGDLIRVLDYRPLRDERAKSRSIRIEAEPTDYFTFISSNHAWDVLSGQQADSLRASERATAHEPRHSLLANPLSVSVSVIVNHNGKEWILIQRRNTSKAFHCKQEFQCSSAGMVSLTRDMRSHGIDVFETAKNELEEELGMHVREDQVTFLGLLRETRFYEVGLVAEVYVTGDPDALLRPRADAFEVVDVFRCEFTPEHYARFIRDHGGPANFVPLGVGAVLYSLMKRFSIERVEAAMKLAP